MSDFEDDENFGLADTDIPAVEGRPSQIDRSSAFAVEDEEDDIYGDLAGPASTYSPITVKEASTVGAEPRKQQDERALALVERQNSGSQAESHAGPSKAKPGPASRKPLPKILADTKVVYIGELEWWTTDADIETTCSEFGVIDSVTFFEEKSSGKSKGYCLVKFTNKEAANLCRHEMNGKCVVTFSYNSNAVSKKPREQQASIPQGQRNQGYNSREQQYNNRGWGTAQGGMAVPPMPPWQGLGMGMTGLPMPGMAMPYMDSMNQPAEIDYKRRRY